MIEVVLTNTPSRAQFSLLHASGAGEDVASHPRRHFEDGFAEMQAMALGRRRDPAPTRIQANLPGVCVFDPLGEMRVCHGPDPLTARIADDQNSAPFARPM
jgi:hypothetical protein